MEKERDIYIKDMLFYILRKWRIILVWMVIFAVGVNGIFALKSYKNMVDSQQNHSAEDVLGALKAGLTNEDVKQVEDAYESYVIYKKLLDDSIDYYNQSIKMQINPNHVATISMQYHISDASKLKDIVESYSNAILSEDVCEYINQSAGLNSKTSYISELIEFNLKEFEKNTVNIIEDSKSNAMLITIIAPNKEVCEIIADDVEEEIQKKTSQIQEKLGNYSIEKIDRNYANKANSDLLNEQQAILMNINATRTSITNLSTNFSEAQNSYYIALIEYNEDNTKSENVNNPAAFKPINIKALFVGVFVGAFLVMCWYAFLYMLDGKLKSEEEIEERYGVPVIGAIRINDNEKNNNPIDRLLYNWFVKSRKKETESILPLICMNILVYAKKQDMQSIYITSVADSENVEKIEKQIGDIIQKEGLNYSVGKSILKNMESLNALVDAEGIVFIEEIGESDFTELGKAINICTKNDISVIGAVVID